MPPKVTRRIAPAAPTARASSQEQLRLQARRRRRWALWALLFPLLFTTLIAIGLVAMFYKRMEIFLPAHGAATVLPCCAALIHARAAALDSAQV